MRTPRSVLVVCAVTLVSLGCPGLPEPPCLVGRSDSQSFYDNLAAYLVQLRPRGDFPASCPQGQQYQVLWPSMYTTYGKADPPPVVTFQLAGSTVAPASGAQATGSFTTFLTPPGSDVCTVPMLTQAMDDSATPVNAPTPVGPTSYTFSEMKVLSDAAHRGNQLEAFALVDYGIPECALLEYVAQAVFPMTACLDDSICLPDVVPGAPLNPAGRGLGSQLSPDNRTFCNLDPALLGNTEVATILGYVGAGPGAYVDADGGTHDVGICFYSDPFPSLCPAGSSLEQTGPCVVGPGSNPH